MAMNGPLRTPFDSPLVSTPDVGASTVRGAGVTLNTDGAAGLQNTPFEKPLVSSPSQEPTANSSGIPADWLTVGSIPNDPGAGATAAVADGVATPNTPAGNMAGGKDLADNIGVGKL